MAYKSLFQPISEHEMNKFRQNHFIAEEEEYDPRAIFLNEDTGVNATAAAPAQPQTAQQQQPAQPQTAPAQPQTAQQPVQQQQPAQPQNNFQLKPENILNDATWSAFQQNPSYETFKAFANKFQQLVQKIDQQNGGADNQTPAQPQGQGPSNGAAPQQPAQPVQQQQTPQQPAQQVTEGMKRFAEAMNRMNSVGYNKLNESDDSSEDDDTETPKKSDSGSSSKTTGSSSSSKGDFDKTNDVTYDGTYKKDDAGSEKDFGWDAMMKKSIFGTSEDPFDQDNDVTYSSEYSASISNADRDKVTWNITPTKAEPYNPEKPSFTSLSNPNALTKTVFTTGKVDIKDAPTVSTPAPAAGGDIKKSESGSTKSSSESTPKTEPKKKEDDGSDDANESFNTNYDNFLNESSISEELKRVILQEFLNDNDGEFELSEFHDWILDNYPKIISDPNVFDEITAEVERASNDGHFNEEDEIDDEEVDELNDDGIEDIEIEDAVDEYMEQYDGDEYDEEDARDWFEEEFETDDDELMEIFLDLVSDQFIEDDIDESFDDEFFANEKYLKD